MHRRLTAVAALVALTAGCSARYDFQAGTLDSTRTLEHDGVQRRFALFESTADGPRPLVVVLHGGGATLKTFLVERSGGASPFASTWLNLADAEGFHVVMPEGVDKHWNSCRADCDGCEPEVDDVGFLTALIDQVASDVEVDIDHIHVAGESNGGLMTQRMARERGDRFGSVAVVNAATPAGTECTDALGPISIAYVVGTADATFPWDGGDGGRGIMESAEQTITYWTGVNDCQAEPTRERLPDLDPDDASTVEQQVWECPEARQIVRYEVAGGGHIPPSIAEHTSSWYNRIAGAQNHDMETSHAMWSFFQAHPR